LAWRRRISKRRIGKPAGRPTVPVEQRQLENGPSGGQDRIGE